MYVLRLAVDDHHLVAIADRVEDSAIRVELLTLLVVVNDLHAGAAPNFAGVRCEVPDQQTQQRGLTGSIWPDEPDAVSAHDANRCIADDWSSAKPPGDVVGIEHDLP